MSESEPIDRFEELLEAMTLAIADLRRENEIRRRSDYEGVLSALSDKLLARWSAPPEWSRGGPPFAQFALVRHNGAVWQSVARTSEEPSPDSHHWLMLTDGMAGFEFSRSVPGHITLKSRSTSGREQTLVVREPVPVFRGVYDPEKSYRTWDTVAKDGHVFLCLTDTPTAGPGREAILGEWQVISGPRGRKGKDADVDEIVARVLREVIPQLQKAMDQIEDHVEAAMP